MSSLGAMLLAVMVVGMLLSYHIGHTVGRREGWAQGRSEGKREGAVRAYAVGYDRGRHDRQVKQADSPDSTPVMSRLAAQGCLLWFLPILVTLLAVILAAATGSLRFAP